MNEKVKAFLLKVEEAPELQEKLSQIRDPDEAYQLASGLVDGLSKEEFIAEMTKLYESQMQDLSEEDLAVVAGGVDKEEILQLTGLGVSVVGASAAFF